MKAFRQAWLALAFVIAPGRALADTPSEVSAEATAAMKRGTAAFARRDAETALAEYKKAQQLVPDANLPYRYAAEALVELERYEDAIAEYETYLRIKPNVSDAGEIRKRIEAARARIDGTIDVTSSPHGASVFVDGSSSKSGTTPLSGLRLHRGSHTLVFRLAGRKDVSLNAVVRGGETLKFVANFADESPPSPPPVVHEKPTTEPSRSRTLGWIVFGAGAVVLGGGVVLDTLVVPSKFDSFEEQRRRDDPGAGGTLGDAQQFQVMSIVGYAAGGALTATGLVLLLWPGKSKPPVKAGVGLGSAVLGGTF